MIFEDCRTLWLLADQEILWKVLQHGSLDFLILVQGIWGICSLKVPRDAFSMIKTRWCVASLAIILFLKALWSMWIWLEIFFLYSFYLFYFWIHELVSSFNPMIGPLPCFSLEIIQFLKLLLLCLIYYIDYLLHGFPSPQWSWFSDNDPILHKIRERPSALASFCSHDAI